MRTRVSVSSVEQLESRMFLSAVPADAALAAAAAKGGKPAPTAGPEIRLDVVALHEFGHALGLDHEATAAPSIMDPYYDPNYQFSSAAFASDPAVLQLNAMLSNPATYAWKDSDSNSSNGIQITYSFMLDGARMEKGSSELFATMNRLFGNSNWRDIFVQQLNRWSDATGGKIRFVPFDADGVENAAYAFNTFSADLQNDSRFGDIRIGAHRFDGAGKTLAHTYFPPPNGSSAAGDAHFDASENWVYTGSLSTINLVATSSTGSGSLEIGRASKAAKLIGLIADSYDVLA